MQGQKTKALILICTLVQLCTYSYAQNEALSPLSENFDLTSTKKEVRMFPSLFVYEIDTILLPFLDDFSRDRFKPYNAQAGDANVTSQTFFRLYDAAGTVLLHDSVKYMRNPTYYITYDSIAGVLVTTINPLDSVLITVNDLTSYPITGVQEYVYPRYSIIDTLWQPSSPDTIYIQNVDLVQDSVYVNFVSSAGDNSLWVDRFAYLNNRFPIGPPTIGVATLDGLNDEGYPYDFVNTTLTGVCDYLTSKPIDLDIKPNTFPYTAADSVYLSFFYQQTGRGNQPEVGDSLILEFWSPSANDWFRQWASPGALAFNDFRQVLVPVLQNMFFENGFRFRFRNIGNLSGSLDHWHIDYVYMAANRNRNDTIRQDVAYQYDALSLLKEFSRMPWEHYKLNPTFYMADTMSLYQRNNDNVARIIVAQNMVVKYQGVTQGTITAPNIPSVAAVSNFSSLFDINASGYSFDPLVADSCAVEFDITASFNPGSNFQLNDTLHFKQVFNDEYAYDDGTAEAAYGPQGANAYLAYKFEIQQADTLRSIRIHFSPSVNDVSNKLFILHVWDASGPGITPGSVIYQNTFLQTPEYVMENNGFYEYPLAQPVVVNGTYFIGWKQLDPDKLNIGFDLNTNRQSKIYYRTAASWIQTGFQGALMMRPVFDRCIGDVTSVEDFSPEEMQLRLFPNPATDEVVIDSDLNNGTIEIYDLGGRLISTTITTGTVRLGVSLLQNGVYLVAFINDQGARAVRKLIIQR
ncbi:MAG TPA: hypothetical protein DCD96_07040 [Flavobacteriales bacterium]|nr:hypothetical protein [Flavobacteriales bacterium]HRE73098.1 T9SS type A sorting domain-containing protein [Flavobacteriales bacterium]HRJ35560.1 T9SS type A sorting domain-containing protein [Flavobacteriales bacterium]HRJ37798.1 T9SS type A sorting domain-containing protein [Flavobacteriales bacterium]